MFAGCQNDFQVQWYYTKERQKKNNSLLDQHHLGAGSEPNRSGNTCRNIHTFETYIATHIYLRCTIHQINIFLYLMASCRRYIKNTDLLVFTTQNTYKGILN